MENTSAQNNSSCEICGEYRSIAFAPFDFRETKVDYKVKTDNPLDSFVDFLLHKTNPDYKTICFAHNGGRFDTIMVYKNLFKRGMAPEMIRRGNKLIEMSIGKTKKPSKKTKKRSETKEAKETKGKFTETIFRDSFNLTHMPLSAFVKAFDLGIEKNAFPLLLYTRRKL